MNTPIELIQAMFNGAVSAVQGAGRMISEGFKTILYGVTVGEGGAVTYGTTYSDLAQFLFTIGGIGLGIGCAYFFLRLVRRKGN